MKYTLSIIIPAYNEENTIRLILDQVLDLELKDIVLEIVIINDCSTDGTRAILEAYIKEHPEFSIRLMDQEKNMKIDHNKRSKRLRDW